MMIRVFKHFVSVQILVLVALEGVVFGGAIYLGLAARFLSIDSNAFRDFLPVFPKALTYAAVMLSSMSAFGLYRRDMVLGGWRNHLRYLASITVGLVLMTLVFYVVPSLILGRGTFALAVLFSLVGLLATRVWFLQLINHEALKKRVLVLGTGSRVARLEKFLKSESLGNKFRVIGYVPIDGAWHGVRSEMILRDKSSVLALAIKYRVDEIVVGIRDRRHGGLPMDDLLACKLEGINVIDLSSFFERETGHVQIDSLNPSWMVFSDGFCHSSFRNIVKRAFDVVASVVLLALTFPVMLLTAALIVLETGRPVLYRQVRVGECGRLFDVLKFRSMRTDAERSGVPQWATENDSRVTGVGRIIRTLRIDELPQIFNVLKGDMSFVGPRPERPYFVQQLSKEIPFYDSRHSVKPGITGWAQINHPYGASVEDAREKLQYDLYYAKNHSLFLDFIVLLQTVQVVLFGKGAR